MITDYIPLGSANAITTEELVRLTGFNSARELQAGIETLRNQGYVIASKCHDGGGYFIPETAHELKTFIRTVENRAKHSLRSLQSAKRMLDELEEK